MHIMSDISLSLRYYFNSKINPLAENLLNTQINTFSIIETKNIKLYWYYLQKLFDKKQLCIKERQLNS